MRLFPGEPALEFLEHTGSILAPISVGGMSTYELIFDQLGKLGAKQKCDASTITDVKTRIWHAGNAIFLIVGMKNVLSMET